MPSYLGALTLVLMILMVLTRLVLLRRRGIDALDFGRTHPSDFLIPPFVAIYLYLIFAHAFGWATFAHQLLFRSQPIAWIGVLFCLAGLALVFWSLLSFGRSFRVGIDAEHPGALITSGVFALSRNPIYTAMLLIFLAQFLIFPNLLLLVYLLAAAWLVNRQVLREEAFLKQHYGLEYEQYCHRVRRWL